MCGQVTRQSARLGIMVYTVVALVSVLAVSALLHALDLSMGGGVGGALILLVMWVPAFARLIATRTVDREWQPQFPLRRWGQPRAAPMLVPLVTVAAIYLGAYALASLLGVPRDAPVWQGGAVFINVAVNLPLLAGFGGLGAIGEEIGWRGYLQPRLDQLEVQASLLWVIVIETLFHIPVILLGGYLAGGSTAATIALFFALKLGATPVWTWATYRWRTIWMAAWFHAMHNALSQVLVPKALGAGDPRILGEAGVLPVALYLLAAAAIFGITRARSQRWGEFARRSMNQS